MCSAPREIPPVLAVPAQQIAADLIEICVGHRIEPGHLFLVPFMARQIESNTLRGSGGVSGRSGGFPYFFQ